VSSFFGCYERKESLLNHHHDKEEDYYYYTWLAKRGSYDKRDNADFQLHPSY
jgi:hypothetical protein